MTRRTRNRRKVTKIKSDYVQEHEEHQKFRSKQKQYLFRRLIAFGVLFVLVMGTIFVTHYNQRALMDEKQNEYEDKVATLEEYKEENKQLEREIELLSDIDYLLKIARKDYFFSEDGEIIFKLPDEDPSY
ncbi:FtsB family cell division protein [Piscibacillus halophilus]|uniref:Cell division protein DivIC n=1 Tax=Piscibacillus halophilus TaxID=571933 RepID=A0A1H9M169_9BACI|nr:septum formation initiator family protein [Piscibacillus halophilus]SER16813.1 cell division protein DivIC [Piscibacillus halophilus]